AKVLDLQRCLQEKLIFVRRFTGGEIIFHGNELTYSITFTEGELPMPSSVKESFRYLTSFILDAYCLMGLKPSYSCDNPPDATESSFCFASREDYDIIINNRKIGGNAQRRIKNSVFQHGVIPLESDRVKFSNFIREDLSGIEKKSVSLAEALGRNIGFSELTGLLRKSFESVFGVSLKEDVLTKEETLLAKGLKETKYANPEWNFNRKKTILVK
ncbi:lipoate--protein ligase family protein, partial [bacterium]